MALTHTPPPLLGTRAPDFKLPGVDGRTHTLASARGPLGLLVMFISNHCPYVKAIRERLVVDCKDLQHAGIGVVAICSNDAKDYPEDSFEHMKELAKAARFPFAYLHDESQAVAKAYGAVCTPDFFGYNANLELQYRGRLDSAGVATRNASHKRELVDAMIEIAKRGSTKIEQTPSMGCSIKWSKVAR